MLISRLTLLQDRAGFAAWPLRVAYRLYEWRLMRDLADRGALAAEKPMRVTVLGMPASLYVCAKS